ncbi:hypothetical protein Tsubulata_046208 [Turnera subulata]|uniref:Uncharacterized protein n=1 Tax=Turnera subulata TaxID=218843 RepID=A0A9Q0G440_9ROSI|nr:hypothetical protein Tsubulata_046208 [Turnera subulata]
MGRAPCCDKANVKKGPWSPEEDAKLKAYIEQHGTGGNWIALPQKIGLRRCGKSCRLRWLNYLRPNIKHGGFSEEEDNIICSLYISIGSRWSIIAAQLPGRTDNDIKNYWNTRLKKKLLGKQRKEQAGRCGFLRQEIKKECENPMFPAAGAIDQLQAPYWPELPAAAILPSAMMTNLHQDHQHDVIYNDHFIDQELKNLLIKLGGRFSNTIHDEEGSGIISNTTTTTTTRSSFPLDSSCSGTEQVYAADSLQVFSSSPPQINSIDSTTTAAGSQLLDHTTNYNVNGAGTSMFQGLELGFPGLLNELIYSNSSQHLGTMESSFYGVDMSSISSSSGASSAESASWGNMNSLSSPPLVPDFDPCSLQSMTRDPLILEDSRYFGPHYST